MRQTGWWHPTGGPVAATVSGMLAQPGPEALGEGNAAKMPIAPLWSPWAWHLTSSPGVLGAGVGR